MTHLGAKIGIILDNLMKRKIIVLEHQKVSLAISFLLTFCSFEIVSNAPPTSMLSLKHQNHTSKIALQNKELQTLN